MNGLEDKMKQVIILRKDLNMRKGKMVAQGAHASLAVFFNRIEDGYSNLERGHVDNYLILNIDPKEREWIDGTFTKICVGVDSKEELLRLFYQAEASDLPRALIVDSGKTEFDGVPTETAVAIGPASDEIINAITGHLKLL